MALLRGKSWQVWLHYGQLTNSHSQNEALNFEAYWNDFDVTHDAGTVNYGSPLYVNYYRRGLAHNALLVDGEGEEGWHEGELVKFDAQNLTVSASQPKYRPNAKATRTLQIEGDSLRDVATIETTDGKAHSLGLSLQLQGEIASDGVWRDAVAVEHFADKRPKSFGYWKALGALDNQARNQFHGECEKQSGQDASVSRDDEMRCRFSRRARRCAGCAAAASSGGFAGNSGRKSDVYHDDCSGWELKRALQVSSRTKILSTIGSYSTANPERQRRACELVARR